MIRAARLADMAEILDVLSGLYGMAERPLQFDPGHCAMHVARAISDDDWLALVVDLTGVRGVLIASVGTTTASPALVAIEHAWIAPSGWGVRLADAYEAWARARGCAALHLSAHPGATALIRRLGERGFEPAELSMVKLL